MSTATPEKHAYMDGRDDFFSQVVDGLMNRHIVYREDETTAEVGEASPNIANLVFRNQLINVMDEQDYSEHAVDTFLESLDPFERIQEEVGAIDNVNATRALHALLQLRETFRLLFDRVGDRSASEALPAEGDFEAHVMRLFDGIVESCNNRLTGFTTDLVLAHFMDSEEDTGMKWNILSMAKILHDDYLDALDDA